MDLNTTTFFVILYMLNKIVDILKFNRIWSIFPIMRNLNIKISFICYIVQINNMFVLYFIDHNIENSVALFTSNHDDPQLIEYFMFALVLLYIATLDVLLFSEIRLFHKYCFKNRFNGIL